MCVVLPEGEGSRNVPTLSSRESRAILLPGSNEGQSLAVRVCTMQGNSQVDSDDYKIGYHAGPLNLFSLGHMDEPSTFSDTFRDHKLFQHIKYTRIRIRSEKALGFSDPFRVLDRYKLCRNLL